MFWCMVFSTFTSMYKWDRLGPSALCWDTLLQSSHMDKHLLQQKNIEKKKKKNYKGLKITACIGSWGKLWATRQKRPKNQLLLLRFWEQQQLLRMIPARGTTRGWWTTSATLLAQPLACPHPRLIWGTYSPPLREQAREVVTCFCCLLLQPKSQ